MFPFNSMLQPIFDQYMLELYQSGVIDRILQFYEPKLETCEMEEIHSVDINFVILAFKIILFGIILSLLFVAMEKCEIRVLEYFNDWFSLPK